MRTATAVLLLALLSACASHPVLSQSATLPEQVRAEPAGYLVVTIRNPVVLAPIRAASTPRGYDGGGPYIAGGAALEASKSLAADYGLVEVSSWPIAILGVHCLVYGVPQGSDSGEVLAALKRDSRVESVQPLQAFNTQAEAYNDPYAQLQQNVATMAIGEAHSVSRGGGVRIAVVDTGADVAHPDLRPNAARGRNFVNADAAEFREDAHGTAVAGVIGAVPNNGLGIVGIAPDVDLLVYKACWRARAVATGPDGAPAVCNTFTLAQALAAAIEARADIINLSLGGPSDPLLTRLIRRALADGAIVVGAMPRDGIRHGFPVEIDGVVAVDMTEAGRQLAGVVSAPGRDVLSLAPDGHYDFYSGSSLAAAEVSGLIALLKAERPALTAREAVALLNDSAAGGASGPNACAALASLRHRGQCAQRGEKVASAAHSGST
jgi:subtilisin family serine protease